MLSFIQPVREFLVEQKERAVLKAKAFIQEWQKTEYKYPSLLAAAAMLSLYLSGVGMIPMLWMSAASFLTGFAAIKAGREALDFYRHVKDIVQHVDETVTKTNRVITELEAPIPVHVEGAPELSGVQALKSQLNQTILEARATIAELNAPIPVEVEGAAPLGGVQALKSQLNQTIVEARGILTDIRAPLLPVLPAQEIVLQNDGPALDQENQPIPPLAAPVDPNGVQQLKLKLATTINHLDRLLQEVNVTAENANSAAQTTATYMAPLTGIASGFRSVGNYFRGGPSSSSSSSTPRPN